MKSSCNVIPAGSGYASSWLPEEFLGLEEQPSEARVKDLIDVFHLVENHTGKPKVSALIARAEDAKADCSCWTPEELHWASPFSAEDWMEFESPANGSGDDAQPASLTSESIRHAEDEAAEIVAQAKKHAQEILDQASQSAFASAVRSQATSNGA